MQKQKKSCSALRVSSRSYRLHPAFTLVELLIVFSLLAILAASSLVGFVNSQRSFLFNGAVQQVVGLVREARSLALSGKAVLDYTDYDQDGCYDLIITAHQVGCALAANDPDYITPAHYGIFFDDSSNTLTLFADLNGGINGSGTAGQYDAPLMATSLGEFEAGRDIKLNSYQLPPALSLILEPAATTTLLYSPIFADPSFDPALGAGDTFLLFGVREDTGPVLNRRCFVIHPAAGVPETAQKAEVQNLCI